MNLLLDTHTVLWFWWNDPKLSEVAKNTIADPENRKLVSTATCWEMAIKVSLKKLDFGLPYEEFVPRQIAINCFEMLTISHDHLALAACLPFHHRDPFDRMLIVQAMGEDIPIVSADTQFDAYPVERVW